MDKMEAGVLIGITVGLMKLLDKLISYVISKRNGNGNGKSKDNAVLEKDVALNKQQTAQNKKDIENHSSTFTRVFDKLDEIKNLIIANRGL